MPRPMMCRRVRGMPCVDRFKPAGIRAAMLEEVMLSVDEFESIRLKDLEDMEQKEAAEKMGVSQPTFQRIYASARKKIADSLVNGKALRIEGGHYRITERRANK